MRKQKQIMVVVAAAIISSVTLITAWGGHEVFARTLFYITILAIAGVAGFIGFLLKPVHWYLAVLLGAVIGFACYYALQSYDQCCVLPS